MPISRKLTHALLALVALITISTVARAACGTVTAFTPATPSATGLLSIANGEDGSVETLVIAAGVTLTNQNLLVVGASVCISNEVFQTPEDESTPLIGAVISRFPGATLSVPGIALPPTSEVSDQKAGSVLVYNIYTSGTTGSTTQNTRINLTNIHPTSSISVHLFFIDGATCSVADSFVCLTQSQTVSFLASDLDPAVTGYIIAVATNNQGCPISYNYLIGDEYVKMTSGHAGNLGAEAFSALFGPDFSSVGDCGAGESIVEISFDGEQFSRAPRVLADDNIPSAADGNNTLIVIDSLTGNLATGAISLGSVFGLLFDDAENALSFTFQAGTCQFRSALSDSFPRTAPRFSRVIQAGRSGWMKFWATSPKGIVGAAFNLNPNAVTTSGAFNGAHNLHKLTLLENLLVETEGGVNGSIAGDELFIPVFPPGCNR